MSSITPAFVLGLYGGNGLSIVRSLGKENIDVYGFHIGSRFPIARYSKYIKETFILDTKEQLLNKIIEIATRLNCKPVVFTTDDDYIPFLEENATQLENIVINPYSCNGKYSKLLNKSTNIILGLNSGFTVPEIITDTKAIDLNREYMIKPENSILGSKEDFYVLKGNQISERHIPVQPSENKYVVQQYFDDKTCEHISVTGYYSREHMYYICMCKRLHALSTKTNKQLRPYTSSWTSYWNDSLIRPIKKLLQNIDLHVPVNIDLIHDKISDEFYYLETNFRIGGDHMIFTKAGMNFPAISYWDLTQSYTKLSGINNTLKINATLIQENRELNYLMFDRNASFLQSFNELGSNKYYMFFDSLDLKPFFVMINQEIKFYAHKQ